MCAGARGFISRARGVGVVTCRMFPVTTTFSAGARALYVRAFQVEKRDPRRGRGCLPAACDGSWLCRCAAGQEACAGGLGETSREKGTTGRRTTEDGRRFSHVPSVEVRPDNPLSFSVSPCLCGSRLGQFRARLRRAKRREHGAAAPQPRDQSEFHHRGTETQRSAQQSIVILCVSVSRWFKAWSVPSRAAPQPRDRSVGVSPQRHRDTKIHASNRTRLPAGQDVVGAGRQGWDAGG